MARKWWTNRAVDLLMREYEAKGPQWCASQLGVSAKRVTNKANRLGLKTRVARGRPFAKGSDSRRGKGFLA